MPAVLRDAFSRDMVMLITPPHVNFHMMHNVVPTRVRIPESGRPRLQSVIGTTAAFLTHLNVSSTETWFNSPTGEVCDIYGVLSDSKGGLIGERVNLVRNWIRFCFHTFFSRRVQRMRSVRGRSW
jgi:hypothetical protein